jgi:hypothetical protein
MLQPAQQKQEKLRLGYVGEAVLQCAIVARLHIRHRRITASDVIEKITDFVGEAKGKNWNPPLASRKTVMISRQLEYSAENKGVTEMDDVMNYISVNKETYDFLKTNISDQRLRKLINDSVSYVNSKEPTEHAEYFYTNKRVDLLEVESLGVVGQQKDAQGDILTKADIRTTYREGYTPGNQTSGTKHEYNLNISVKIKGEKQFGQVSGLTGDRMKIFASAVGVKLDKNIIKQINIIAETLPQRNKTNKDVERTHQKVMELLYPYMADQINKGSRGSYSRFLDGVFNFIALRDPGVTVVDIGSGSYKKYVTNILASMRKRRNSEIVMTAKAYGTKGKGNYNLLVYVSSSDKYVVKLSSRTQGTTARNFILAGPELQKWLLKLD